jgi:type II secretory ATPase GspE/PulE/Tfp pilus assembly ATPase PilB-like protein
MSNTFLQKSVGDLQRTLDDVNRKMQEEQTMSKAVSLSLPYVNLRRFPIDLNVLGLFTADEAKNAESIPFYKELHDVRIATINPQNQLLLEKIKELSPKYKISLYYVSRASFEQTLKFYSKVLTPKSTYHENIVVEEKLDFSKILHDLSDEGEQRAKNVTDFIGLIFAAAMSVSASDIHFEPEDHFIKLRFRVDGVLQDVLHVAKDLQKSLVARLKILSKLKLNVDNLPQDGRITFQYLGKPVDVRVSTLPSAYGEGIVMRLLGTGAVNLKVSELGFEGRAKNIVEESLQRPNGMIITTGPTGSGKTTTLYAFLNELNETGVKIITLEDPVEYKLEGIQQTPIDHTVDFNFAKALRAVLRQDPDIVMVGEIRDAETAEAGLQAALTGHVVLSTLHTNDAAGAVPRLITMGVKPFVIAPALNAVIAQRLVRKLCEACKQPIKLDPSVLEKVILWLKQIPENSEVTVPEKKEFFHSPGCEACHNLGYKGRIGIYEVIQVNDAMKELILKNASTTDVKKQAIADGMITMLQDGLLKALAGVTDVEEVFRVAGA